MPRLQDFPVFNFNGGVRRDKSYFELDRNELIDARNIELIDRGRIRVRRGSHQMGDTASGIIENSYVYERLSGTVTTFITSTRANPTVLRYLASSRLTGDITTASTTVGLYDDSSFASSGNAEIEGDLIAYTGKSSGFTGVTGITRNHSAGAAVHQWRTLTQSGTGMDGRRGIYFATLNDICVMAGRGSNWKQISNNDGLTITDLTGNALGGLFLTNYRDRLYCSGDAGDERTISFSAIGDPTSWPAANFIDVEDQRGEFISALKLNNDRLLIFKLNSTFTYDEIELKQRQSYVGAYNDKVVQEIGGLLYTFCPSGIFETNGFSSRQIGEPVREFWKNFIPSFDTVTSAAYGRVVQNTFAGKFEDRYFLYIFDITVPTETNDVVLEYNTTKNAWTVHTGGFTNFAHFLPSEHFKYADYSQQFRPALFAGDTAGKYYRFFESRYRDAQTTPTIQGSDIFTDLSSDTQTPVSASFETTMYDLTHPDMWKIFGTMKAYAEVGEWLVEYRIETDEGISDYRRLGVVRNATTLSFPKDAQGWRVGFRISTTARVHTPIFNGFTLRDTFITNRK